MSEGFNGWHAITKRTGNRVIHMALELEQLAARLRAAGWKDEACDLMIAFAKCRSVGDRINSAPDIPAGRSD